MPNSRVIGMNTIIVGELSLRVAVYESLRLRSTAYLLLTLQKCF